MISFITYSITGWVNIQSHCGSIFSHRVGHYSVTTKPLIINICKSILWQAEADEQAKQAEDESVAHDEAAAAHIQPPFDLAANSQPGKRARDTVFNPPHINPLTHHSTVSNPKSFTPSQVKACILAL
jgi:hypothetical protein